MHTRHVSGPVLTWALVAAFAAWPLPCPPSCPADVNGDCVVDVTDLVAVILGWG
jgi:hypothetical protein